MPNDCKARVFVSHSSKDNLFARKLVEALKRQNLNVWFDEGELQVGDSIVAGVSQGLKNADYLIAVLSKASIGSGWVEAELNATLMEELSGKGVAVLPVLIEDCELPTLLKDRVYADFRHDFNTGLQKLLAVFGQEGESAANAAPEVATKEASEFKDRTLLTTYLNRISSRFDRDFDFNFVPLSTQPGSIQPRPLAVRIAHERLRESLSSGTSPLPPLRDVEPDFHHQQAVPNNSSTGTGG